MEYFYNNKWYTYNELHNQFGFTPSAANPLTLYDTDLGFYISWEYEDEYWVVKDTKWYPYADLPYYIKTEDVESLWIAEKPLSLTIYRNAKEELVEYEESLKSVLELHDNYGITRTKSTIYTIDEGVVTSWYNADEGEKPYWDNITKQWVKEYQRHDADSGYFLLNNTDGRIYRYGDIIDGKLLVPICINIPDNGLFSYTLTGGAVSGSWKIKTTVIPSVSEKVIVIATKKSDDAPETESETPATTSASESISTSSVSITEYTL